MFDQRTHRPHIEHLSEVDTFALHLSPDAVDVLWPSGQFDRYLGRCAGAAQASIHIGDKSLPLTTFAVELPGQADVLIRLEMAQTQILQLPFQLPDTEPVGQRGMHQLGLPGDPPLQLRRQALEPAHQLQTLGQHDEDRTYVVRDTQQHSTQLLYAAFVDLRPDADSSRIRETCSSIAPTAGPKRRSISAAS